MLQLTRISWRNVGLVVACWFALWLVVIAAAVGISLRAFTTNASRVSGGFAEVGFGVNAEGILLVVGPPLLFVALRLVAGSFARRSAEQSK